MVTLLALLLAVAAGFRLFGIGADYVYYQEFYDRIGLATDIADERFEIGYSAGAWVFKMILGLPYAVYASVLVGFALTVKFSCFYRYCDRSLLACLVYCASFYPLHEYTQIRIAVALAFGMLGCLASTRGRLVEAAIWIGIGASFHTSEAALALGVGIAFLIRFSWRTAVVCLLITAATVYLAFPSDPIAIAANSNLFAQEYVNDAGPVVVNFLGSGNVVTVLSVILCFPVAFTSRDKVVVLALVMCALASAIFAMLIDFAVLASRFREVFAIFGLLLVFRRSATFPVRLAGYLTAAAGIYQLASAIQDGII